MRSISAFLTQLIALGVIRVWLLQGCGSEKWGDMDVVEKNSCFGVGEREGIDLIIFSRQ